MLRSPKTIQLRQIAQSWQLFLLGITSLVLSLASGWTTWNGMRNFTNEPVLSLMITLGVQGVMLVLAWFIGIRVSEHVFDTRPQNTGSPNGAVTRFLSKVAEIITFVLAAATILYLVGNYFGGKQLLPTRILGFELPGPLLISLGLSLALLATIKFGMLLLQGALGFLHFIVLNVTSVSMFAVCIFISIFFSFDSLFTIVLPESERQRIAELRSKTDVSSLVSSIKSATDEARSREMRALVTNPAWTKYNASLSEISGSLRKVPDIVGEKIEAAQNRANAQEQERLNALAQLSAQRQMPLRRVSELKSSLQDYEKRSQLLQAKIAELDQEILRFDRKILDKTAEIDAELQGIGVTSRRGRGPQYRRLTDQRNVLKKTHANLVARRTEYRQRVESNEDEVRKRNVEITQLEEKARRIERSMAPLQAKQGTRQQGPTKKDIEAETSSWISRVATARLNFEQTPDREKLSTLHAECNEAMSFVAAQAPGAFGLNRAACETSGLQLAATRLFELNSARQHLSKACTADATNSVGTEIEARLSYVRSCLQLASLKPDEAKPIARSINTLDRDRDDKAHRFVVTLNAFLDGNKLALLAVAIASAMDVLVLASGLLGAASIRSPLAKSMTRNDLTASQREIIVETALLPSVAQNARFTLGQLRPALTPEAGTRDTWSYELLLDPNNQNNYSAMLRRLVNAGIMIGAAKAADMRQSRYLLNVAIIEFLSKLARSADAEDDTRLEFRRLLSEALGPEPGVHAKAILPYFSPSLGYTNYSSQIDLAKVQSSDTDALNRCLNVSSAYGHVAQSDETNHAQSVLVSAEVYLAVLELSSSHYPEDDANVQVSTVRSSGASDIASDIQTQISNMQVGDSGSNLQRLDEEIASSSRHEPSKEPAMMPEGDVSHEDLPKSAPGEADKASASPLHKQKTSDQPETNSEPKKPPKVLISDGTFTFD